MNLLRPFQTLASLSGALAVALLSLPGHAADQSFASRLDIPDAVLRNVTYVVCATFPEDAEPALPVYARKGDRFQRTGALPRERTVPVSRVDGGDWQEYCFPASETMEAVEAGGTFMYAHAVIDAYTGKKAWLREGGEPGQVWVNLESLGTLGAFEDMRVEFYALRRDSQPLALREEPRDDAKAVDAGLPVDVILGQRIGGYAEVLAYEPERTGYRRLGWVRVEDPSGLLLLWPGYFETHGC